MLFCYSIVIILYDCIVVWYDYMILFLYDRLMTMSCYITILSRAYTISGISLSYYDILEFLYFIIWSYYHTIIFLYCTRYYHCVVISFHSINIFLIWYCPTKVFFLLLSHYRICNMILHHYLRLYCYVVFLYYFNTIPWTKHQCIIIYY